MIFQRNWASELGKCNWSFFYSRASEGKTVEIVYRGDVHMTVLDILGGLRSTCTYVGAQKLKEISKRTTFIRVTQQTNEIFTWHAVNDQNRSVMLFE